MDENRLMTLAEIHEAELRLLLVFHDFCQEHGLRYSLQAGTLIGAVRHRGFIPWDDDIDVSMPRPDVERLLELVDELPQGFSIHGPENSAFVCSFYKFVDLSIIAQEPAYEGLYEEHLWLDIFPMDGTSSDPGEVKKTQNAMSDAIRWSAWVDTNPSSNPLWKRAIKAVVVPILRLTNPRKRMIKLANRIALNPGYDNATRVSSFMGGSRSGWSLSRAEYEDMVDMEFEGHMFRAMGCWDEYLRTCYGDYMTLPPESQRATHHLKAWRIS